MPAAAWRWGVAPSRVRLAVVPVAPPASLGLSLVSRGVAFPVFAPVCPCLPGAGVPFLRWSSLVACSSPVPWAFSSLPLSAWRSLFGAAWSPVALASRCRAFSAALVPAVGPAVPLLPSVVAWSSAGLSLAA